VNIFKQAPWFPRHSRLSWRFVTPSLTEPLQKHQVIHKSHELSRYITFSIPPSSSLFVTGTKQQDS
jgi:hypothetical protein